MHDEQYILLCRMRIAERLADAERARLLDSVARDGTVRRIIAVRVGGTLVRVGQWLQVVGEARDVARRVDTLPQCTEPRFAHHGNGRIRY